jgi:hypothetical protein
MAVDGLFFKECVTVARGIVSLDPPQNGEEQTNGVGKHTVE